MNPTDLMNERNSYDYESAIERLVEVAYSIVSEVENIEPPDDNPTELKRLNVKLKAIERILLKTRKSVETVVNK